MGDWRTAFSWTAHWCHRGEWRTTTEPLRCLTEEGPTQGGWGGEWQPHYHAVFHTSMVYVALWMKLFTALLFSQPCYITSWAVGTNFSFFTALQVGDSCQLLNWRQWPLVGISHTTQHIISFRNICASYLPSSSFSFKTNMQRAKVKIKLNPGNINAQSPALVISHALTPSHSSPWSL